MEKRIDLSVIIATKNESHNLPRLLQSLKKQTFEDFETIVVDNFSTDRTTTIAKEFTSHVFSHGDERSAQRNFGAAKARGKYFLFLDADMELPQTIISEIVDGFKNKKAVALIIPETVPGHTFFMKVKRLEKKLYENEPTIEAPRAFLEDAFRKIKGYTEDLIAGEDWDIGNRIKKIGSIKRINTPLFHHETSFLRELKHKMYYAKHIHEYKKKHPSAFKKQSGYQRMQLFWKKRHLFLASPHVGISLVVLKSLEFLLYQVVFRFL